VIALTDCGRAIERAYEFLEVHLLNLLGLGKFYGVAVIDSAAYDGTRLELVLHRRSHQSQEKPSGRSFPEATSQEL
jgi:hypothetical protein